MRSAWVDEARLRDVVTATDPPWRPSFATQNLNAVLGHAMGRDRPHLPLLPPGDPGRLGGDEPGHHPQAAGGAPQEKAEPVPPRPDQAQAAVPAVIEPPEHEGQTYDLDDELTIGRSPGCGVSMPEDIYTSTLHARLFRRNDQLWVEDLGSTNGTYVNSEKITQAVRWARATCSRSAPPSSRSR
jgi:hypothetical protein